LTSIEDLRSELVALKDEATQFLANALITIVQKRGEPEIPNRSFYGLPPEWEYLSEDQWLTGLRLRKRLAQCGVRLIEAVRESPLMEQADEAEVRRLLRVMSASLVGKWYRYHPAYAIAEEDRVYGMEPASHEEEYVTMNACADNFEKAYADLLDKMDLIAPAPENLARAIVASQVPSVQKYRPNTAFIMMQINTSIPELEDVKNCIKEAFKEFGIEAVRSDEIEHSETITQRILDEISTSEFLIADLTGERPSVYYEVGYAHAAGKRPILVPQTGNTIAF
jgi:hypothetical protein